MSIDRSKTSFLTSGSNGGIDDEYYVNEIIGIDELTYEDYVKKPKKEQQQLEFDSDKDLKIPFQRKFMPTNKKKYMREYMQKARKLGKIIHWRQYQKLKQSKIKRKQHEQYR